MLAYYLTSSSVFVPLLTLLLLLISLTSLTPPRLFDPASCLSLSSCALSPDSHLSYCSSSHHLLALLHVTAYTSHLSPCSSSARLELHLRRPQKIHNNRHNHNRNLYGIGEKPANGHLWSRRRAMDEGREGGAAAGVEGRCKGRRVGD